ncbi:MAG: ECF transporter S component [Candidatus Thorarchaeota archaeon]|nr:ECF transporter S component [Candidatus Thorarchaeota archaeon]
MENTAESSSDQELEDEMVIVSGPMSPTIYIVLIALMTALTTVATVVFIIPFPSTAGYFNLGDAMVMVSGILLGPIGGLVAGGVGSAMGDVALNFLPFAPITLAVKGGEGLVVGMISRYAKSGKKISPWDIFGVLLGSIIMLAGYLVGEVMVLGISSGLALFELITINSIQVIMGSIVALIVGPMLRNFLQNYTLERK